MLIIRRFSCCSLYCYWYWLLLCGVIYLWSFYLEALSWRSELKFCLEALNKYVIFILLFGSFGWKLCLKVLNWSFVWKFCLEALNKYVIFILLLCEYLIETFFVLKYVAWYFYMWYVELVCLFEYWVCIFVLVIFHWACCQYRWFLYAWVSCALLLERNLENVYGYFFEPICY